MCWLQPPSLFWGFLLPMGIMMSINLGIFVILLKKVAFNSRKVIINFFNICFLLVLELFFLIQKITSTAKDKSFHERLVNVFTMFFMMGLTWMLGYFLLITQDVLFQEVFQWIFTIFNFSQVSIDYFHKTFYKRTLLNIYDNFKLIKN